MSSAGLGRHYFMRGNNHSDQTVITSLNKGALSVWIITDIKAFDENDAEICGILPLVQCKYFQHGTEVSFSILSSNPEMKLLHSI